MHLAVDVRLGDVIEIDQGDLPQPASGQRLCGPGADAADANHTGVRALETTERLLAVELREAAEAASRIRPQRNQGRITVQPVVLRLSRSRCAWTTSASL